MPKAMHLLRKGQTRSNGRGQPKAAPVKAYAPGYFTELVRQHNWPPMWKPAPEAQRTGWTEAHGKRMTEYLREHKLGFFAPGMGLGLPGALAGPAPESPCRRRPRA